MNFKLKITRLAIVFILGVTLIVSSVHTVPSGSVGFVSTFNVISTETRAPGITFTIPFVQQLKTITVQQVTVDEEFHVQTADNQVITITGTAIYNVNPKNAASTAINIGTDADKIKANALQSQLLAVTKQIVNTRNMDQAINEQGKIADEIQMQLKAKLDKAGVIEFDVFNITGFKPSDDVQNAIEQRQVALQKKQQALTDLETAKITAQSNKVLSDSISPVLNTHEAIQKWDGKTQVFNLNGNATNTSIILPSK